MNAKLVESAPPHPMFRSVLMEIAGLDCPGIVTGVNEDGSVQVHAFHPSGIVVHDGVELIEEEAPALDFNLADVPGGLDGSEPRFSGTDAAPSTTPPQTAMTPTETATTQASGEELASTAETSDAAHPVGEANAAQGD